MIIPWLKKPHDPRHILGLKGEQAAVHHLRKNGCRILKRNYCAADGEIDIIAERLGTVHFIEVKTRGSDMHGSPEEAVNRQKQARVLRAAQHYLAGFRRQPEAVSYDILAVVFDPGTKKPQIRWIPSAF